MPTMPPVSRLPSLIIGAAITLLAAPAAASAQAKEPFTTEDALNVAQVSVEALTADGRFMAATRSTSSDSKNIDHMRFGDPTYISPSVADVLVIDTETGQETALFEGKRQTRGFDWSPDGRSLAFLVLEDGRYSLYVHERERSRTRRVEIRTDRKIASSSDLEWRPDGSGVLLSLRAAGWAEASRRAFEDLSFGPVIVQSSEDPFLAWDAVRNRGALAIPAVVDLASREVRELFDSEVTLQGLTQSRDGRHVSFVRVTPKKTSYTRTGGDGYDVQTLSLVDGSIRTLREETETRPGISWNDDGTAFAYAEEGDIFVQSIDEGEARNLTRPGEPGRSGADGTPSATAVEADSSRTRYSFVQWRRDGQAVLASSDAGLYLIHIIDPSPELVLEMPAADSSAPRRRAVSWSPDGRHLYLTYSARDRWERGLERYDLETRQTRDLVKSSDVYGGWQFSEDGGRVVYSWSDGDMPSELFVADAEFARPRRLTDLNPWLADRTITRSELVEYLDVDGRTLYGILYYPVDYVEGRRYPLVAEVYEEFFDNGFNHRMNLLANAGFFGFRPSVRLEIGYPGEAWLKGVTAGINSLIERGLVDGEKLGVHGTSYGGYATNLLITQTDRFKAAINISGKVNIISFLGDSPKITTRNYNAAEMGQDRIGATLWEQPQKYLAHTAILDADRIETPLLLMSGEGDWNVPATNQREMYYALRRLGKEVVWVHYMNAGHGAGRSSTVEDFHDHWSRIIAWYSDHFAEDAQATIAEDAASGGGG